MDGVGSGSEVLCMFAVARVARSSWRIAVLSAACVVGLAAPAWSQTNPLVQPYTATTLAGNSAGVAATAVGIGKLCNGGGTPAAGNNSPVATDLFNDGCPAAQAIFSTDLRGGVATDPQGNVFVLDGGNGGNNILRKIDARSGIITAVVGAPGAVPCAAAIDKTGDGCPFVNAGQFNSPRGVATDPYGNILIAGYSDQLLHLVCNVVGPICSAGQIGTMRAVAGCVTGVAAYGSGGAGADGVPAVTNTGTCSSAVSQVNQPRGGTIDGFGNIYFGDTGTGRYRVVLGPQTFNGVTNPLFAVLATYPAYSTPVAGYIYAFIGGAQFTPATMGAACTGSGTALDTFGDGCSFFQTKDYGTGIPVQAVGTDTLGNVFFQDYVNSAVIRVMYMGGATVANAITVNNPTVTTPLVGHVYLLAGNGGTGTGAAPVIGSAANFGAQILKLTVDQRTGNVYANASSNVFFFNMQTGYITKIAAGAAACATPTDAAGDGCPIAMTSFAGSNGAGLAVDNLGNLYVGDYGTSHGPLVRRFAASTYGNVTAGTTFAPGFQVLSSAAAGNATPTLGANTDFTLGAPTCTANVSDGTNSCLSAVTVTPTGLGLRTAPVTIASTTGSTLTSLTANGVGTSLVFDPIGVAPSVALLSGTNQPTAVAVDGAGNTYTSISSGGFQIVKSTAGVVSNIYTSTSAVTQIAVDPQGNVYLANGASVLTKLTFTAPNTYAATNLSIGSFGTLKTVAVDANGNVYVGNNAGQVIRSTQNNAQTLVLTATSLTTIANLALDNNGNLLIADSGAGTVYKLPVYGVTSGLPTVVVSGVAPVAVAADVAGDAYYADSAAKNVVMVPVASGANATVIGGLTTPNGIAVDGVGNVSVADSAAAGVTVVKRNAFSYAFPNTSTTLSGTITNVGNQVSTGFNQQDAADFQLAGAGATCVPGTTAIAPGASCTIAATFVPTGGGTVVNVISLKPVLNNFGALTLSGTAAGNAVTTTTMIGGQTPSAPVYTASGAEVTFTVTVTASAGNPTGSVNVSLDGGAAVQYALTAGPGTTSTATVALSGLSAATHMLSATYPTTGSYTGSGTATATSFTIAQAPTTVTFSPATMTQQFSQAIGTGVFDAFASSGASVVPGAFVYTATPTAGGTALMVDASSYLPIGSYTFAVTFTPTDTVDYTGSAKTLTSAYTVTKATTTAAVGASTNVVAADGSGNFTSVETAMKSLPVTGGNLYIAPGTYAEQVLVPYPNVALRGLGGNAAAVVLTSETGAYGGANPALGIPANPFGFNNDEASATLVVAKSGSTVPNNFYMDNLSLINTFDTDAANANAIMGSNQTCTAVTGSSNNALFNAGQLCASQALTLWITADKSVLNNVRMLSLQDTLAAYNTTGSNSCSGIACSSRQYYWKNYITGDIDYVFGDAAAVFDQTSFYTQYHNGSNTGNATVFAQNKSQQTGSAGDYLSGYVANNSAFTSQMTPMGAMTSLYYGRPYGVYSTTALINNSVDDVAPAGWEQFSGTSNLATSTYIEYGTTGAGAATLGQRETTSIQPSVGTAALVAKYLPTTFLSSPAPDVWNATAALATGINSYVPTGNTATINFGQSITILARPQTPGGGAIPTGSYTLSDNGTTIQSGTLDASGATYLTSKTFATGNHAFTLTYAGDANFSGSTSTAFTLTVTGTTSTTTLNVTTANPTYGQPVSVAATVTGASPTGNVALSVDGGTPITQAISGGRVSFTLAGLSAGTHTLSAVYSGDAANTSSTGTGSVTLAKAVLTVAANNLTVGYGQTVPAYSSTISGFVYSDTAASAVTGTASLSTVPANPVNAGTYTITAGPGSLAANNYTFNFASGSLTITKAALTVTAISTGVTYGQTVPPYSSIFTGFVNGDTAANSVTGTPSLTTTPANPMNVGTYTITAGPGTLASNNYSFSFVNGTVTITKAVLSVSGPLVAITYGQQIPAYVPSYFGFANGDNASTAFTGSPSLTTSPGTPVNAGTYTITTTNGTLASNNYTFTFVNGQLTIYKALLSVNPNSVTRPYQTANVLTYNLVGFVNGDNASAVNGQPTLTTTATRNSPAGNYPINSGVGSLSAVNYNFSFGTAILTVQGGASESVIFGRLPNLPHGLTAPLFGRSTSGLPVTYTVTSGPATIVTNNSGGSSIQVTGTGPVTVVASQPGNATFAAATSVTRSFTAQ